DIFTVVSLKDSEMMTNYHFDINSINFLTIPFAKEEEYFDAFYRHLFLKYKKHINHEKLYNLSSAFKTNNYSLKDAVTLFAKHLKNISEQDKNIDIYFSFNKYFSTPIEEKIDFDSDLILDKDIKERIRREFRNFIERKPEAKKGIILTGPPGTGKTMIAKSVANMEGFHFMPLRLSDLKQLYVGHSGAEVKKIFDKARSLEPTVIFIDEIDAIFPKRDDMMTDSFAKDITNEFISQTDGVDTGQQRIFIIGATNIPEVLDSAVISRFELQTIPLPAAKEREKIFESYIPSLKENNWQRLNKFTFLDKTEGLSGRDIKDVSNTIKTLINKKGSTIPDKDIFDISLEVFKEKVISTNRDKFEYISMKKNRNNFNQIVGYNSIKKEIKNAISSILREAELKYYNIEAERGILLEGPPGNGKSYIAQCIAGEFNLDFIKVLSKDISTRFYSEDAKKLSEIFNAAFKIARLSKNGCVLFFDEFDGIAAKSANLNLRATMLDLIVKSREVPNLVLIAATNYKEYLDEASIREGRFDTKIRINNPSKEDIFDLIRNFLKEMDKISDKNKIDNKISHQMYERILDYLFSLNENSRSIAGIKSFSNNLKRQSFFAKKQDNEKRLIIDDETVMDYLAKN
ncbi:MAG: AAA family ATPase, partial [Candidatus Sericytochromatia bacterium]